jgi:hypothetical protein
VAKALEGVLDLLELRQPCAKADTSGAKAKARQTSRIKELGDALVSSGLCTLDEQAKALGLSRSTTWTVLRANHKASGLSATVINQMLAAPPLPALVRARILAYIDEKNTGSYGHSKVQLRRFAARLELAGLDPYLMSSTRQSRGHYRRDLDPATLA